MWRGTSVRLVAGVISCALFLSACGVPAADPNLSPAENQLRQDNARFNDTVTTGAVIGAVLGTAVGLGLGALTHQRGDVILALAAGGAAAGAALGGGAGYTVARNNYQAQRSEANLQKAIAEAQTDLAAYQKSADASYRIAQEAKQKSAQLQAQYHAQQVTIVAYRQQLQQYQADAAIMEKQIAGMQKEADQLRADAASQPNNSESYGSIARQMDTARKNTQGALSQIKDALSHAPAGA